MIKRITLFFMIVTVFFLYNSFLKNVYADEETKSKSQLTLPWDEFKKAVHFDENEIIISLEIYQKILAQTGIKTTPNHTIKDGNVILTKDEFKKLINKMQPFLWKLFIAWYRTDFPCSAHVVQFYQQLIC